jgi:hypothetical protein
MIFMANPILAGSPQETTDRIERGLAIFEDRYNEVEHVAGDTWAVPSSNLLVGTYLVRLRDNPSCECADFSYRHRECKHIAAARAAESKSRVCSCCNRKVLGRFTTEVSEDDGLLSWFPGDVLCADCIREGFWV